MKRIMFALGIATAMTVPAIAQEEGTTQASFIGADGEEIGAATLLDTAEGVLIEIEVSGLPADQWVAFHVHEEGVCDPDDDHESAGDHYNPTDAEHGYLIEGGPHAGDMPNLYVDAEGVLRAEVFNSFVRLDEGDAPIRERALLIHAGADDYQSQPSGDAGDRLACAVIE